MIGRLVRDVAIRSWMPGVGVCVFVLAWPAAANVPVLGPEAAQMIPGLLAPDAPGSELAPGIRIGGIAVHATGIAIEVTSPRDSAHLLLELRPPDTPQSARTSRSFVPGFQPDPLPESLAPAVTRLWERIVQNDDGTMLAKATGLRAALRNQEADGAPPPPRERVVAAALMWLALVLLGLGAAIRTRASWRLPRSPWFWACVCAVALSAGLRATTPRTLLHANNHGIEDLGAVVGMPILSPQPAPWIRLMGASGVVAQRATTTLLGGTDLAVFDGAAVWGTLATAATAASAWVVSGSPAGALAAALLHASWPLAGRVARSESVLAVVVFLVALLPGLLFRLREHPGIRAAAGAALVCGLAATAHPAGILACTGTLLVFPPWRSGLPWRRGAVLGWALAVGVVGAGAAVAWSAVGDRTGDEILRVTSLGLLSPGAYLLSGHGWTPPALFLGALVGAGLAGFAGPGSRLRRGAGALLALVGFATFLWLTRFRFTGFGDALRYQSLATPLVAVLAAFVPVRLASLAKSAPSRIAGTALRGTAALLVAGIVLAALLDRGPWTTRDIEALDYEYAAALAASLPHGAIVVVPADPAPAGTDRVYHHFPAFAASRTGRKIEVMSEDTWRQRLASNATRADRTFLWRGTSCQATSMTRDELLPPGGPLGVAERPECRRLVQELAETPLARTVLPRVDGPTPYETFHRYPDPRPHSVLYRVRMPAPAPSTPPNSPSGNTPAAGSSAID